MPAHVLEILMKNLEVDREDVYQIKGPLALSRLRILSAVDRPELKDPPFVAAIPAALEAQDEGEDIFAAIRRQDILLQHPFDSFQPVVSFLQKAATRPSRARHQDHALPRRPECPGSGSPARSG